LSLSVIALRNGSPLAYSKLRMLRKLPQVLGLDLNRSVGRGAAAPVGLSRQTDYRQESLNLSGASSAAPWCRGRHWPARSRSPASTCEGGRGTAFSPDLRSGRIAHGMPLRRKVLHLLLLPLSPPKSEGCISSATRANAGRQHPPLFEVTRRAVNTNEVANICDRQQKNDSCGRGPVHDGVFSPKRRRPAAKLSHPKQSLECAAT
jgi:hypothetical protein